MSFGALVLWSSNTQHDDENKQAMVGVGMGCLMCYGSKVGWYHRVFLPIIVLELAGGRGSIWGAIDLCALCMVAAGTTAQCDQKRTYYVLTV